MTALEVFNAGDWSVRTDLVDGEPWFVARDVCAALELADVTSLRSLDDDEKGTHTVPTPGGNQAVTVINEAGLYSLILRSRKPEAKAFKRWITHDVLPAIRRTGSYSPAKFEIPTNLADALQLASNLERQRLALVEKVAEDKPKVELAEAVLEAAGDFSVRETAQALTRDHGIVTGQKRLFSYIRELGWIDRNGHPYQRHIERGVIAVRVTSYDHPHSGEPQISTQVRVTPKGLSELHRRMAVAS